MGPSGREQTLFPPSAASSRVRDAVREVYDRVGREGSRSPVGCAAPTGAALARDLGYPPGELERLPAEVLDAFVGAAALGLEVEGSPGEVVADLGCGAGLDALVLSGRGFRVVAIDGSPPMLARLARCPESAGRGGLAILRANLPEVPLASGVASWALMNGVLNLVAERHAMLREVRRVLRPGGVFLAADLFALGPIPEAVRELPEAWAWCVAGAASPEEWVRALSREGFADVSVEVRERFPPLARGVLRAGTRARGAKR